MTSFSGEQNRCRQTGLSEFQYIFKESGRLCLLFACVEATVKTIYLKGEKYDTETVYIHHLCVKTVLEK